MLIVITFHFPIVMLPFQFFFFFLSPASVPLSSVKPKQVVSDQSDDNYS